MSNQKNIMFLGPYPPPYGGIASHLRTFIPFLHTKGITNTIVVNFGEQDKKEIVENIIIYRYNPKRHFLLLINPCNFHLIFKIILSLSIQSINFIQIIQESIKGVIINQLVIT